MPHTERIKCLLVDDIPENLVALEALLQGEGIEILTAQSGPEALSCCSRTPMWRWPCWTSRCPR